MSLIARSNSLRTAEASIFLTSVLDDSSELQLSSQAVAPSLLCHYCLPHGNKHCFWHGAPLTLFTENFGTAIRLHKNIGTNSFASTALFKALSERFSFP